MNTDECAARLGRERRHERVGHERRDLRGDGGGLPGAHPDQGARACARERQPKAPRPWEVLLETAEHRREAGAVGLMQPVVQRAREGAEIAVRERQHEEGGALQAVDGVCSRHLGPQVLARLGRAELVIRHGEHEREAGRRSMRRTSGASPSSASVNPPAIAAATLSGCPSMGAASAISSSAPCGRPCSARPAASPATIAALDEPVPDCKRTSLCMRNARPSSGPSQTSANERTTRLDSSQGSVAAPSPVTLTASGPGRRSTSTTLRIGSATPRQS